MDLNWLTVLANSFSINKDNIFWFDEIAAKKNISNKDDPEDIQGGDLKKTFANLLYNYFYCVGEPMLIGFYKSLITNNRNEDISESLDSHNYGSGRIEAGWIYKGKNQLNPEYLNVSNNDFQISIPPHLIVDEYKEKLILNSSLQIIMPASSFGRSQGFYLAHSNAPFSNDEQITRIYINVEPRYVSFLMKLITVNLNKEEIAFDFKVCKNLKDFYRCDVSVLYVYKTSFNQVIDLLSFNFKDMIMKGYFKNKIPSMTYKLFEGVGVADCPEDGDSFGLNRCRIISDGIISSLEETNISKKIEAIKLAFENYNLSVEKPYLNSDSNDIYEKYIE